MNMSELSALITRLAEILHLANSSQKTLIVMVAAIFGIAILSAVIRIIKRNALKILLFFILFCIVCITAAALLPLNVPVISKVMLAGLVSILITVGISIFLKIAGNVLDTSIDKIFHDDKFKNLRGPGGY